ARRPGGPALVLAGSAEGAPGNDIPAILRDTIGLNAKVVSGYPDSSAMFLAMERGEVHGRTVDLSTLRTFRSNWLQPGSGMHVLLQFARRTRHPQLPDIPMARELAPTGDALALIELTEQPYAMARPFAAPPEVPQDRAQALQAAFLDTHSDPQYLEEAAKLKIDVSPVSGAAVLEMVGRVAGASPRSGDRLRKLLTESKGGG